MALVEAAASGLPIVSTDVGIASELITNDVDSFVCTEDTEECLAQKILMLGSDAELRAVLGKRLSERVRTFVRTKEEYLEEYKRSIESAHRQLRTDKN